MPEQEGNGPTLQLDEAGENDFRVFSVIENTLIGILFFVATYFRVCWVLLRYPGLASVLLAPDRQGRTVAKPLTYLGVSSFLGGLVLLSLDPFRGYPLDIKKEIQEISFASMLKAVFPVVFIVVGLALVLARIIGRRNRLRRLQIVQIVCYSTGYQFLLLTGLLLGNLIYYKKIIWNEKVEFVLGTLAWGLSAYAVFIPGIILWKATKSSLPNTRLMIGRFTWVMAFEMFGCIVFLAATLAATASRSIDPWALIGMEERKVDLACLAARAKLINPDTLQLTVLIRNEASQPLFLYRSPTSMTIDWWMVQANGWKMTQESDPIPMSVSSWSDGDTAVLALEPRQTKWMVSYLRFPPGLSGILASSSSYPILVRQINFTAVEPSSVTCSMEKEILASPNMLRLK